MKNYKKNTNSDESMIIADLELTTGDFADKIDMIEYYCYDRISGGSAG